MKNVLCFGDSNTYGRRPDGLRYERWERWTGILQQLLGEEYYVIEEGNNGRTTVYDDWIETDKCGLLQLPSALSSHRPLDLVILMLGTNDLKPRFGAPVNDIAEGAGRLVKLIQKYDFKPRFADPEILLVSPILVGETVAAGAYSEKLFGQTAKERSERLGELYAKTARSMGVHFMDAAQYAGPSEADGLHMTAEGHAALAQAFYEKVKEIIG